jgi:hypothetical protein
MTDEARPQIIFSVLKFCTSDGRWPSFTATIDLWCCNRPRNVGLTSIVSGDLGDVCLVFGIFQLLFTVLELLLLPLYGGYYLFLVFQYVVRRRSYYGCVRRPQKYMFSIWNFPLTIHPYGIITTSGLWRLVSTYGFAICRATSIILPLYRATSKMYA